MIPTGTIKFQGAETGFHAQIVLGPDIVTYYASDVGGVSWESRPLTALSWIEWDDFPFQPEGGDEIAFLQQFISNLSPDDLEAAVEAQIGVDGMHRQGEWMKAALLRMVPE